MARELSQGELLDFLLGQAGGRVANAALLAHFRRFLRDPEASPEELRSRRERFKGFVNSVATVRQEGPQGAKYVVLRKRYRELVGEEEEEKEKEAAAKPLPPEALQSPCRRAAPRPARKEEKHTCKASSPGQVKVPPSAASPALGALRGPGSLLGGEPPGKPPPAGCRAPLGLWGGGLDLPVREMGAPLASQAQAQERIRQWVATHHPPPFPPDAPQLDPHPSCLTPDPSLDAPPLREPLPIFRSIRCQLSLQDLEDFIEQESSASEDGSSASGGSDSRHLEGSPGRHLPRGPRWQNGHLKKRDPKGVQPKPQGNGLMASKKSTAQQNGTIPEHLALLSQVAGRANKPWGKEGEWHSKDQTKPRLAARLPPPKLDAPLSPQPLSRQGNARADLEGPVPDTDGSTEHRASLVPLEPREHAWLVKVATGSWMQARALLLEDPHLATRKDFISGFTVLHWLAKHGNAQVLQDVVTGARKAGVPLDVDVKSGCGYTPLHLAAMHGHQVVIKVLVQKLQCHVQVRDSSGKRPWQYLSSSTSGEVWQLLGAPRGQTIFAAHPITRNTNCSPARKGKSPELGRKISRKASLAAYLKPQHIKWKMGSKCPPLHEREEYSD
ncbi:ankyrin repeat domain-containing protein SOWAHB [Sceloporus undulatus]|uniref:ankyrin repeat domain-containing protein SOWAHB n=1 Tax=Sceloporus undulatus TaxID=8520 RepID=UPI001C4AD571|nr:ankyrin repeat domain-containing protein SOWAHB [Sceloporus undulatus]